MGTVGRLDPFFQNLIDYTMYQERQPLERLTQQKDSFNVQKNLYEGLQTRLKELQELAHALVSTDASTAVKEGRSYSITPFGDKAVLSASTSSSTPIGDYAVHVNSLATAHQARGSQSLQSSMDMAEEISGEFFLGGTASASFITGTKTNTTVANFTSFTDEEGDKLVTGQKQLGSGSYSVQIREDATAGWQFRLVDSYGQAVSIQSGNDTTTFTSSWQSVTDGEYNTGRGLKINFSTAPEDLLAGAADVTWQSKGASIIAEVTDSLTAIANKINAATYADGDGVSASVVDKRLVLSARSTGTDHTIKANDNIGEALEELDILDSGGDYVVGSETAATNATLTVNGSALITRSKNTGLTDVISGITLNLTGKHTGAEDVDTLSVTANMEGPKTALNSFLTKFNEAVMFLDENTSVTKIADGQYTRGGLAEDTIFSDLRSQLFTAFSDQYTSYTISDVPYTNSGSYKSMYEIGLSLDDNLNVTISDSAKLENALNNDLDSVKSLLDGVMRTVDFQLGQFTGDNPKKQSGYINNAIQGFDGQIFQIGIDTKDMNVRLDTKQASLVAQYAEMQTQLLNLQYMQQTWSSIYGGMKSFF